MTSVDANQFFYAYQPIVTSNSSSIGPIPIQDNYFYYSNDYSFQNNLNLFYNFVFTPAQEDTGWDK